MGFLNKYTTDVTYDDITKQGKKKKNKWFTLKSGQATVRILPDKNCNNPYVVTHSHWVTPETFTAIGMGPEDIANLLETKPWLERGGFVLCGRHHGDGTCPVCAEYWKQHEAGVAREDLRHLSLSTRITVNVVVRGQEEEGPQLFSMSKTAYKTIKRVSEVKKINPTCPQNGVDFLVEKEKGKTHELMDCGASPLWEDEDEAESWIESSVDLKTLAENHNTSELVAKGGTSIVDDLAG